MKNLPKVTFIIVARNEGKSLPRLLHDLLSQDYPVEKLELLFIDSKSTDQTKTLMTSFLEEHLECDGKIFDNDGVSLACGWNVALENATGDIIGRVDGHGSIPADFISNNVERILQGEKIVGGTTQYREPKSEWSEVLGIAERSAFGGSTASFRRKGELRYVDTLAYAFYSKDVFDEVGRYNECLGRTEDNEMHYRMRSAGYKFCFDPNITSTHECRSTLRHMIKQKIYNGLWVGLTLCVQPRCFSYRHFVPLLFVLAIIFCLFMLVVGAIWPIIILFTTYMSVSIYFTIASIVGSETKKTFKLFFIPLVFLLCHVAYGLGTLCGIMSIPFFMKRNMKKSKEQPN